MDNEKLEIVGNEELASAGRNSWSTGIDTKAITSQALPLAGGVTVGIIGGYLLCRFVIKPLIAKAKAKKEATKVEPETTESKNEES